MADKSEKKQQRHLKSNVKILIFAIIVVIFLALIYVIYALLQSSSPSQLPDFTNMGIIKNNYTILLNRCSQTKALPGTGLKLVCTESFIASSNSSILPNTIVVSKFGFENASFARGYLKNFSRNLSGGPAYPSLLETNASATNTSSIYVAMLYKNLNGFNGTYLDLGIFQMYGANIIGVSAIAPTNVSTANITSAEASTSSNYNNTRDILLHLLTELQSKYPNQI